VGLRAALAAARTAADAARAKLSAEQIGAQQRLAGFEKLKAELEARRPSLLLDLVLGHLHAPGKSPVSGAPDARLRRVMVCASQHAGQAAGA